MDEAQMTELHSKYTGQGADYNLVMLIHYLGGKPDTPGWRRLFRSTGTMNNDSDFTPVPYKGRIIPQWAIEEYYFVQSEMPSVGNQTKYAWPDIPSPHEMIECLRSDLERRIHEMEERFKQLE